MYKFNDLSPEEQKKQVGSRLRLGRTVHGQVKHVNVSVQSCAQRLNLG